MRNTRDRHKTKNVEGFVKESKFASVVKTGYVLGLNGWFSRSHDAAACLVKDGKIIAMVEEERFTRKKHAYDTVPIKATLWCLNEAGITLDEVDKVAVGWDYTKLYKLSGMKDKRLDNLVDVYFPKKYFQYSKRPSIELIPHHLAHAASSFYTSGMKKASILVVDGQGEDASATLAYGDKNGLKVIDTVPISASLGYFYEAVSDFIGLGVDAAGKTMGLAPYGKPKYKFNPDLFKVDCIKGVLDQQQHIVSKWREEFIKMFGKPNSVKNIFRPVYGDIHKQIRLNTLHKNIAASAQISLEKAMLNLVDQLILRTKEPNLCMAGGVALNCSSNSAILKSGLIKNLYIPPVANDAGVALGAAMLIGGNQSANELTHACFGPSYSNTQIKAVLDKTGCKYRKIKNVTSEVAELLAKGKIVSWFQGRAEIGPRALGSRSILANPSISGIGIKVNKAKDRELWRPLAPSILKEYACDYLEKSVLSPFMLHTFQVKDKMKKKVSSIVHVDGTTRPQTVSKIDNPKYYKMINKFREKTGIPMVLNTSFNGAKEPIVCTPVDAITSFFSNSIDVLAIGDFLVNKNE